MPEQPPSASSSATTGLGAIAPLAAVEQDRAALVVGAAKAQAVFQHEARARW
jgi:hypothetical protein